MSTLSDDDLGRLYRYAMTLTRDRGRAYDLVHTAIVRWLDAGDVRVRQPRRYLMVTVRNMHFDDGRRHKLHHPEPIEHHEELSGSDQELMEDALIRAEHVERIWRLLRDAERELLFLWAVEGFTMAEISTHTGIPRGTLLARLRRLRLRISACEEVRLLGGLT